jgi:hypothetical protein
MMRLSDSSRKHLMVNFGMQEGGQQNLIPLMNFFEVEIWHMAYRD